MAASPMVIREGRDTASIGASTTGIAHHSQVLVKMLPAKSFSSLSLS